jgi:hypothetical protein
MRSTEKILALIGLLSAVVGAALGLFIYVVVSTGPADGDAYQNLLLALPVPATGFAICSLALMLGWRRRALSVFPTAIAGGLLSGGILALVVGKIFSFQ